MQEQDNKEQGFTLIELLIAIVVVGILTAVAIVGIAGLTNKGNDSACAATLDAAQSAAAVHYTNNQGQYPTSFTQMETATPPELTVANGVKDTGASLAGNGWTITIAGGGAVPNTWTAKLTNGTDCNTGTGGT